MSKAATNGGVESDPKRRPKSSDLRPLARLFPIVLRYRGRLVMALIALLLAAGATLAVPLAVRRVIDHGFSDANAGFIDKYFLMMLIVVALLAFASAARFYFVTWIGERVVADVRDEVFGKLMALSPSFFETMRSGEVMSRLTADTTQIKSMFGSSASVCLAQSGNAGGIGHHDGRDIAEAFRLYADGPAVDCIASGVVRAQGAFTVAPGARYTG